MITRKYLETYIDKRLSKTTAELIEYIDFKIEPLQRSIELMQEDIKIIKGAYCLVTQL